jgi:hypothetical protein
MRALYIGLQLGELAPTSELCRLQGSHAQHVTLNLLLRDNSVLAFVSVVRPSCRSRGPGPTHSFTARPSVPLLSGLSLHCEIE